MNLAQMLKQLNADNRLHYPRSAAVLGLTLYFCRPNVLSPKRQYTSQTLESFRCHLKTYYFQSAYLAL